MTTAEKLIRKGEMRGKAKQMAEGKMERDFKIVKNAIQLGMEKEQIVQLTGLSLEEMDKIARDTDCK